MLDAAGAEGLALLVVDSDANDLYYTAKLLQRFGYRVSMARNGADALQMTETLVPSLILTALGLPDMDGNGMLRMLRRDGRCASVPVIALTGSPDPSVEQSCLRDGFAACLRKPVGAEDLYQAVRGRLEPDRRGVTRIEARIPVLVNDEPVDCIGGECSSFISEHGMYIRTPRPHPARTRLAIRMDVNGRAIRADAVVLYSHDHGEGPFGEPGMGIRFSRIAPGDREHLRTYISSSLAAANRSAKNARNRRDTQ
jgi:CheY-like chemotaxis protein